jgi:condensin complex subunit 1
MMRILMESRQIHVDVINKLWQVYSKYDAKNTGALGLISAPAYSNPARELPKQQRRGAVIILGMLAVASPRIVEARREDLINIGLGVRGKVSRPALLISNSDREGGRRT